MQEKHIPHKGELGKVYEGNLFNALRMLYRLCILQTNSTTLKINKKLNLD